MEILVAALIAVALVTACCLVLYRRSRQGSGSRHGHRLVASDAELDARARSASQRSSDQGSGPH